MVIKTNDVDQYVITSCYQHPSLYQADTFLEMKMKVLDQLFNTIGNGIETNEELEEHLKEFIDHSITKQDIIHYIDGSPVYYGYTKVKSVKIGNATYFKPADYMEVPVVVPESKRGSYSSEMLWIPCRKHDLRLYPNFSEDYSLVYRIPEALENSKFLVAAAIEFYEFAKQWFESKESQEYSYYYPKSSNKENDKFLYEMKETFSHYTSHQEISYAYGIDYDGDVESFCIRRWNTEKERIMKFIQSTLKMLNGYGSVHTEIQLGDVEQPSLYPNKENL